MATTILKRITNRAKEIRRRSGGSWKSALKKAGSEFKGKKSAPAKRPKKSSVKKYRAEHVRRVPNSGSESLSHHISEAKKILLDRIADKERQKFVARLKVDKRRIQKEISEYKRQYRKLK